MSEEQLAQLLADWCAPRSIDPELMLANGFRLDHHRDYGPAAILTEYRFSNGERAADRILILDPARRNGGREWRVDGGALKGAAWQLGNPRGAEYVVIAEGESCGLAGWSCLMTDGRFGVLVVPGSRMVPDDLASFVGNSTRVVIATDADEAGDQCAAACIKALLSASHPADLIRRLRPEVPGKEEPDLRDLVSHTQAVGDPQALVRAIIDAPVTQPDEDLLTEAREAIKQATATTNSPFVLASGVVERPVEWLWHRRLPTVGLVVLAGDGGVGKSTLSQKIASAVTRGEALPFGGTAGPPRGVLVLSAEEDTAAVMRPRMRLMGAALDRVMFLDPEHGAGFTLPSGIDQLEAECVEINAGMVVIDSGPAFMDKGLKPNDEADIRRMLRPLAALAERRELLVVVLAHLNKGQASAGHRVMGGAAWRNAPRLVLMIGVPDQQHPGETDQRMIVVEKSNLGKYPDAVSFRLATFDENPDLADVQWGQEHSDVSAADLVTAAADPKEHSRLNEATDWLTEALANGPKPAAELLAAARSDGIAERTLRRSSKRLGVNTRKASLGGGWEWSLPEVAKTTPTVPDVATFGAEEAENPMPTEGDTKGPTSQPLAASGRFDEQAVFEEYSTEDGQPGQLHASWATLLPTRSVCRRCQELWPGPGTVCDACLDGEA